MSRTDAKAAERALLASFESGEIDASEFIRRADQISDRSGREARTIASLRSRLGEL